MASTLYDYLIRADQLGNDFLLGKFLDCIADRKLELYPAQEEAILELYGEKNVILNTPTGSGKSLVASALHFKSVAQGKRSVYTCPIKALVNEKWLSLCREFGAENVGLSTGDATINREAPILCCTAEILANMALRDGPTANVHDVVMDEFHYYSDRDRGAAWQIPLLTLPQTRFLLMSATLGDTTFFETELTRINARPTVTIASTRRPVPLEFTYSETSLAQTLEALLEADKGPVYVVHFSQNEAAESAQDFTSLNVANREEKAALATVLDGFKFASPYGPDIRRWLRAGIGLHHAGLLPKYRILIEQLAQRGLLKVICGTDTLGVGINVPIRTVLFTRLCKYDGQKTAILAARDFHQISGRAGRKGYDNVGWVVAQAPEHVVENRKLEEKSKRDGKKVVKRQPPDRNFVNWDQQTYTRLISAAPERLTSRFQITHAVLLNVLGRPGDGCAAMRDLIRRCHDSDKAKKNHFRRAWELFRTLVDRRIVELPSPKDESQPGVSLGTDPTAGADVPEARPTVSPAGPSKLRINLSLPENFSLDQALSLFLLDTLPQMDRQAPDYAFDLITLVEGILEDPDVILRRQLDRLKGQKIAELKQQGMEYDARMEELEKLEYPKPKAEYFYATFNAWAVQHPWIGQENIRLKSIAREMFEEFRSFSDYVKRYELQRAEGVLLRHLNSVYKVHKQTVPAAAKTEAVQEMELYLGTMIRQVDSSLMDEWERLRNPAFQPKADVPEARPPGAEEAAQDVTRDLRSFTAALRTKVFTFLRAWTDGDSETALGLLASPEVIAGPPWTAARLQGAIEAFEANHQQLCLNPEARNSRYSYLKAAEDQQSWTLDQVLVDPEGANDWVAVFFVDRAKSKDAKEPILKLLRIGSISYLGEAVQELPD